jgi:aminobenzoyl-glutamate transport protein
MAKASTGTPQMASGSKKGILNWVERVGNTFPHPFFLFLILGVALIAISSIVAGTKVVIPGTDNELAVKSLLNWDGLRFILSTWPKNFIGFNPLPTVLTLMVGVGVAEESGFFRAGLQRAFSNVSPTWITAAIIFIGINGNITSDAGFVFIPALAGSVFASIGRNPVLGIVAGYAAVSGGFSANVLLGSTDALLTGITQSVLDVLPITANYTAHMAMNWFFMTASTFCLVPVGVFITEKIVAPILGDDFEAASIIMAEESDEEQAKGLKSAGIAILAYLLVIVLLAVIPGAPLRDPQTGTILPKSPFMSSLPTLLMLLFLISGLAYGRSVGTIKSGKDLVNMIGKGIGSLSGFLVVAFTASQFIAWFGETNLATVMAVKGAGAIQAAGITSTPVLVILLVLLVSFLNLFIYSSSAKYALVAPIIVPMFALLGFSPAMTQAVYRIGDSCTNIITPLFPYLPLVLAMMQKYKKDAGIGTVISAMLPYSLGFFVMWVALIIIWVSLGLPLGPGAGLFL